MFWLSALLNSSFFFSFFIILLYYYIITISSKGPEISGIQVELPFMINFNIFLLEPAIAEIQINLSPLIYAGARNTRNTGSAVPLSFI